MKAVCMPWKGLVLCSTGNRVPLKGFRHNLQSGKIILVEVRLCNEGVCVSERGMVRPKMETSEEVSQQSRGTCEDLLGKS